MLGFTLLLKAIKKLIITQLCIYICICKIPILNKILNY